MKINDSFNKQYRQYNTDIPTRIHDNEAQELINQTWTDAYN